MTGGSACQKTILARERPSLLLEEKVSPVRTLVTDVVEKVTNSPEVWQNQNILLHTTSVKARLRRAGP